MLKRFLLPITIIILAILVFMVLKVSKPEQEVMAKVEKIWRVDTVPVLFQQRAPEITIYGRIETPRKATLSAALVADVTSVHILEGSEVKAGDVLIQLDDTDVQLLVEQRQSNLAEIMALIVSERERYKRDQGLLEHENELLQLAENAVTRLQKLEHSRLASQTNLDDAFANRQRQILTLKRLQYDIAEHPARLAQLQARKSHAEALLKQAQVDLQRTTITAPFSGRISQLNVAVGNRIRIGEPLLSLYDSSDLEVRAQLPGRYLKQIRSMLSQDHLLMGEARIDNQLLSCSLHRLSGEVRLDSGGIDGLFKLSGNNTSLALGAFVQLTLKLAKQNNVIELPFDALYGMNHVYLFKEGYLQAITINRVGEYTTDEGEKKLLIRSDDLQSNDRIVSTQLPNASTGLRVEVETLSD